MGSNVTISDFIIYNLIPVTIGNFLSGVLFVGLVFGILHKTFSYFKKLLKKIQGMI